MSRARTVIAWVLEDADVPAAENIADAILETLRARGFAVVDCRRETLR